jgi:hypothetical protein
MQQFTLVSEEERSRAGRAHLYTQIAQNAARPRKRQGGWLTEQGWDALLILAFAGGFGLYLGANIVKGLGPVLRAHGL